jgi:hypothetical protein
MKSTINGEIYLFLAPGLFNFEVQTLTFKIRHKECSEISPGNNQLTGAFQCSLFVPQTDK